MTLSKGFIPLDGCALPPTNGKWQMAKGESHIDWGGGGAGEPYFCKSTKIILQHDLNIILHATAFKDCTVCPHGHP